MFNYRLYGFYLSLFMFISVWAVMYNGYATGFDNVYGEAIQSLRSDGLNTFVEAITYIGNWQTITIACLLLLAFGKYCKMFGVPVTIVAASSALVNFIIKHIAQRTRPDVSNMLILEDGYSFPSGHTTTIVAVCCMIAYILYKEYKGKSWKKSLMVVGLIVLMTLVALSRVYLGVHYASDVFAAYFLGLTMFIIVSFFFYRPKAEKAKYEALQEEKAKIYETKQAEKMGKYDDVDAEIVEDETENI